jgi:hypothetical protein
VPLIKPGTMFTPRRTHIDLRVVKALRLTGDRRMQVMPDIFNLTTSNAAIGAARTPTSRLPH